MSDLNHALARRALNHMQSIQLLPDGRHPRNILRDYIDAAELRAETAESRVKELEAKLCTIDAELEAETQNDKRQSSENRSPAHRAQVVDTAQKSAEPRKSI